MIDADDKNLAEQPGFGSWLEHLLFVDGARPPGKKKQGECWTKDEFATAMGVHERTVRDWLTGRKCPVYLNGIENALFDPADPADARKTMLRQAHRRARQREAEQLGGIDDIPIGETEKIPVAVSIPQIFHPEIRPVPSFTGRDDLLAAIERALWREGGAVALTNATAIHGLGGVGKSVLAKHYAWLNRDRYHGVWWLRAETEQTLIDDLIALGSRLVPGLAEIAEREHAVHAALDAIPGAAKPWLLVYDNVETPAALDKLTPRSGAHLLITSRYPRWKGRAEPLPVDVFPPDAAADYLMEDAPPGQTREAALRLAKALGFLPLALAHASAYCAEANLGFDAYAARIADRLKDEDNPVAATFGLAMDKVATACPEAGTLMSIAAFLAPDRIPVALFTPDVIGEDELNKALRALHNVSLIEHDTLDGGARGFSVHRLVQEVARSRLGDGGQETRQIALRLIHNVLNAFSVWEHANWPRVVPLLPHALAVLDDTPNKDEGAETAAAICVKLDLYFSARADYTNALSQSRRALSILEAVLGPDHPDVGTGLDNLAELLGTLGRHGEAEPLSRRALTIRENTLEPHHVHIAISLDNLAGQLRHLARYGEAEPLGRRALTIWERALGPDHPDLAISLNNLALLLSAQGRQCEAEPLYQRALTINGIALGPDHPLVANSLNNLAGLLRDLARHGEAEPLHRRALAIREAALGPDHPDVANSLNNLAGLLGDLARHAEAEPLYRRALAIREAALGPDHPDVAVSLNNLAGLLGGLVRHAEAEPFCRRAVAIFDARLGADHPDTKWAKDSLEACLAAMAAGSMDDEVGPQASPPSKSPRKRGSGTTA